MTPMTPTPARNGFLTSEFMLTVIGVLALLVLTLADEIEGSWAAPAIAFACFGYAASRSFVKKAAVDGENRVAEFKSDLAVLAASPSPAPAAVVNVNTDTDTRAQPGPPPMPVTDERQPEI